jgi:hypothetical protein
MVMVPMFTAKRSGGQEEHGELTAFQSLTIQRIRDEKNKNIRIDHHTDYGLYWL